MRVRGRQQSTMQTEICEDGILKHQALFLRLTAFGDSGWLWTCRKCYSDRNDNESLNITCCKGPQRTHSDTTDSLWVTNSSENTTVALLSYSHAKGITNKISEALSDEQRAREGKLGSHLSLGQIGRLGRLWLLAYITYLRTVSSQPPQLSLHSRAIPWCLEMGFRMLLES